MTRTDRRTPAAGPRHRQDLRRQPRPQGRRPDRRRRRGRRPDRRERRGQEHHPQHRLRGAAVRLGFADPRRPRDRPEDLPGSQPAGHLPGVPGGGAGRLAGRLRERVLRLGAPVPYPHRRSGPPRPAAGHRGRAARRRRRRYRRDATDRPADPGQKQSLDIARVTALAKLLEVERPVVLFDEPTTALDSEHEDNFLRLLQRLRGVAAVVFVSHRLPEIIEDHRPHHCLQRR